MKTPKIAALFLLLALVVSSPAQQPASKLETRLSARFKEFVEQGKTAGAVFVVGQKQSATFGAVGWQDLATKTPMSTDSIFQIASMTKPITALGIMLLVDEGRVALVDPVSKYLPNFADVQVGEKQSDGTIKLRKPARVITVRDLLTHTSGIGGGYPEKFKDNFETRAYPLADVVAAIPTRHLEFDPGKRWSYSNMGIAVLGRIIEVVSGKEYEQFLQERLFTPLGMKDTHCFLPESKRARLATIYKVENNQLVKADVDHFRPNAKYASPEAGIYSTAPDLLKLYQMLLNGGTHLGQRILSKFALEQMTSNHTGELQTGFSPGVAYGLGWAVVRNVEGTFRGQSIGTFAHGGLWKTYAWIDPKREIVGIMMMQRLSSDGDQSDELNAFVQIVAASFE